MMPFLALVLFVLVYPVLSSIFFSFQDTKIPEGAVPFKVATLKNYVRMLDSEDLWHSALNTAIIAACASFLSVAIRK